MLDREKFGKFGTISPNQNHPNLCTSNYPTPANFLCLPLTSTERNICTRPEVIMPALF